MRRTGTIAVYRQYRRRRHAALCRSADSPDMTQSFLDSHPDLAWTSTQKQSSPEDLFIELEALDNAHVDTWVNAQNARTTTAFGKTPQTDALTARLKTAYTSQERIVSCSRYNDWGYNTWQDETHPLGIVRRTPWQKWLAGTPEWQTILDVGKHGISWIDRDTVYVGWDDSAHSKKPALTTSGFPRQARKWKRGTKLADAPVVFEGKRRDVSAGADYDQLEKLHLASRATSFFETLQYWLDETTGEWQQYDVPLHAELEHWNGWLFVTPRESYESGATSGATTYASGSLLVIRRDAFLKGARNFTVLFTPSGRTVLADIDFTKHFLVVSQMDDGSPRVELLAPPADLEGEWSRRNFPLPAA